MKKSTIISRDLEGLHENTKVMDCKSHTEINQNSPLSFTCEEVYNHGLVAIMFSLKGNKSDGFGPFATAVKNIMPVVY